MYVHLTVDTEFNIAGAFSDPETRQPVGSEAVHCDVNGRSEGLGHLLRTLGDHGLRATFFVEALNTCYFGDGPMGEIARAIHDAGHDTQLHLHPCWTYFERPDWKRRLASDPPNDDVTRRSVDEMARLIDLGREAFRRWQLPEPRVLRTGGLRVRLNVYRAMQTCGMPMSSSVGLAVFRPAEQELQLCAGCHAVNGVLELPVTTYTDFRIGNRLHQKTLTVTGTSWPEMRTVLLRARDSGLSDVVVLTHPFEYVKHRDADYRRLYVDRINQRRLEKLCAFLADTPGFEAATLAERLGDCRPGPDNTAISVPPAYALGRIIVNRINHSVMHL